MSEAYRLFPQLALVALVCSAMVSWVVSASVRRVAVRYGWLDRPERAPQRKKHTYPVPLLGGIGVFAGFAVAALILWPWLTSGYLLPKHLLGVLLAGLILLIGGVWDDVRDITPLKQISFPILATLVVISAGIGITEITHPFSGTISLVQWSWTVFQWHDLPYTLVLWADVFGFIWLMSTTYATKFLDGLDGLVAGITVIGGGVIAFLSYQTPVLQPETAVLALCVTGAAAGFLFWNRFPARLYLGEGGSTLCGFLLGALAIISGGKIATALLVLGLPLLDGAWVIWRRIQHKQSPFSGDREHIHQRLLDIGLTQRQVVWALYSVTAGFGLAGLFFQGKEKLVAFGILVCVLGVLGLIAMRTRAPHE